MFFIIISSLVFVSVYVYISVLISRTNGKYIARYTPEIYPVINVAVYLKEGMVIFLMNTLFTCYAVALSENPLIYLAVGLTASFVLLYFISRKRFLLYFTDEKLILWHPSIFEAKAWEVEMKDVESLVYMTGVRAGILCSINLNVGEEKRSAGVDLTYYKREQLTAFFTKLGKPVYSKVYYERVAERIN